MEVVNLLGTWKYGKMVNGIIHDSYGNRKEGDFNNDGRLIKGTMVRADGTRVEGDF
jgi:hypothetical protein